MSVNQPFNAHMVNVHNKYRVVHGVAPVKFDAYLAAGAQQWANHLA